MKKLINICSKKALLFCFLFLSLLANAQQSQLTLVAVPENTTATTFDVDLMLTIPSGGRRLGSVSTGINYNTAILNGGTPCTTAGCGAWALVPGTVATQLTTGLNAPVYTVRSPYSQLRIVQSNNLSTTLDLPAGVYRVGRFRFTNTQ